MKLILCKDDYKGKIYVNVKSINYIEFKSNKEDEEVVKLFLTNGTITSTDYNTVGSIKNLIDQSAY